MKKLMAKYTILGGKFMITMIILGVIAVLLVIIGVAIGSALILGGKIIAVGIPIILVLWLAKRAFFPGIGKGKKED
jgi:hypothetical protein